MAGFQALRGGWLRKLRLHPKVRCAPLVLPQWRLAFSLSGWCAGNAGFIVLRDSHATDCLTRRKRAPIVADNPNIVRQKNHPDWPMEAS